MPVSNYFLDKFVSYELSKLTECNAREVSNRFSQSEFWITNFVLNSVFGHQVNESGRRFAFAFLRRAEYAFTEYEYARKALKGFVEAPTERVSLYFKALSHFEMAISMLWQAYSFIIRAIDEKLFAKGDNSAYEKLNNIYNVSRHFNPSALPDEHLHAVRITNDGIHIEGCNLSFAEIEELLLEIGTLADKVSSVELSK